MEPIELSHGVELRVLARQDAEFLATTYTKNRAHLAPWDAERHEDFFTTAWHEGETAQQLAAYASGAAVPLVLATPTAIVGRVTLSGITRGAFESASLGYWVDEEFSGHGLISAAVGHVVGIARDSVGLHRLQAGTLLHNHASQRVLQKAGFESFGMAPRYLRIAGEWQDHRLFQKILHD
ncbi:acetyltransferase [Cryobacterium roopkundense]|uniref:Acetyltransferase n=1 Tax=Cryobacterium roopkundense TaxID=1001240 RepID=A0A099J7E7_9MICO|nr:GNAT family N-acetyltransferase [Cryobacterium roopkundense]KGJ73383.1 acetyltransferase [Cryobacterium roopkundense]